MTVTIPAHPQILLAVANSQSMDGDLSGAIRTGSGSLGAAFAGLLASSSPVNYTIPAGFTPPANPGAAGVAPYTVASSGLLLDNSASRMNVAKEGLSQILNTYISSADFALTDYSTNGINSYTTWVYQMSQAGGFTFTSTLGANIPGTIEYLPNPCFLSNPLGTDPVSVDCNSLNGRYASQSIFTKRYLVVKFSSDDPSVNDVLYAGGGIDPLCVVFGGPNPPTPFPPNYSLGNYNTGGVSETYAAQVNSCARTTGPTNAGFVPYSTEVMYEERGFGFYTSGESAGGSSTAVPMTSSGATPTPASVAAALAPFAPLLAPETNSRGTPEIKSAATQSPMAGLIAGAQAVFATNPPSSNGCTAQKYVVLITDGLPTLDLAGRAWPPLGSTAAAGYGVSATFNADHSLGVTNDQALTDVIANLTALNARGIKTYVIGLGAGVDATVNPTAAATLQAMAIAGGTGTASPTGFFPAVSPTAMTNDLQIIITKILAATQSVASAAVNSTGLNTNSVVYQSQFLTSDSNQDWDGNLRAFTIAADGSVDTSGVPIWSAAPLLDMLAWDTGRFIATWDPTLNAAIPFQWNSGTPLHGIANSTMLGQDLTTFTPDTNGQDVLQFLRGSRSQELPPNGTGQFRERTHRLGDIVGSDPLYIGAPGTANQTPSYVAFAAARAARPPVIYVGANDGMLHAFDATTGNERFAYIPRGVYANLINLVNPYYNASHLFYVNGSPQASDVQFADLTWHTVLVGTEGAGGNSVYALDVSDPAAISTEAALAGKVLWDFTDPNMGLGFSTPAIASTANGWTVFVGNGYNSPNQKPYLYALNPQTGAVFKKIDLCAAVPTACNLSASNGLSSAIAVNSGGQIAGYANIVYAGDLQGNLWRVDVSNASPALWTVTVLFQATDGANQPQPITTAPTATLNPRYPQYLGTMVFVATGELLGNPDLSNGQVQSIYGIYDPPTTYATPVTRSSLVHQTLTSQSTAFGNVVLDTSVTVNIPTDKGWFVDLSLNSGERVVTDPHLETGGALVVTSYTPSSIACTAGGSSNLYVINYATGGAFTSPQFDLNGDHAITSSDSVGGANPVGLSLGNVFAAAPTIRSANLGTIGAVKLITKSNNTIQSIGEKGSSKSRTAWWEIRQ
ncbi:MAG: PilC/PilY family type IV pilus protein [Pseudomonadota bacterium]|nr:PilC/PilY family type IV pilus protein [Pseudomonadota bacterium]